VTLRKEEKKIMYMESRNRPNSTWKQRKRRIIFFKRYVMFSVKCNAILPFQCGAKLHPYVRSELILPLYYTNDISSFSGPHRAPRLLNARGRYQLT